MNVNRVVTLAIIVLIVAIWFSAMANACTPRGVAGSFGPSWGPPIFFGSGWNQGGWDRGTVSKPSSKSIPAPSRSSGGSILGGGIKGGIGGK
ncbi:MAG: hypothetical protein ACYC66_08350 [Chloroflexota bacterium]